MRGDNAGNHHHERASGAADLCTRSAKRGNQEACKDRAIEPGFGRHPRGDGEGKG